MSSTLHRLDKVTLRLLEPQIVEVKFHDNECIEVEDVIQLKEVNMSMTNDKPYVSMLIMGQLTTYSQEVPKLTATKEFTTRNKAKAIVIGSLGHRMLAQFYLNFHKPYVKTRVFSKKEGALKWLREVLSEYDDEGFEQQSVRG